MNRIILVLLGSIPLLLFATNYTSVNNGDWNDPNTWSPVGIPQVGSSAPWPGDNVTIEHNVSFTGNLTTEKMSTFLIHDGGHLTISGTLDISNNNTSAFTVESDGSISAGNLHITTSSSQINLNGTLMTDDLVYSASQPLLLGGSVTISGSLSGTGGGSIFFVAANASIADASAVAGSVQVFVDGLSDIHFGDLSLTGSADIRGINSGGIVDWNSVSLASSSTVINCVNNNCEYSGASSSSSPPTPLNLADGNRVLPVELLKFEAEIRGDFAVLHWETATEENNDFFRLEVSADGRSYEEVATIDGRGNSEYEQFYQYQDKLRMTGHSYYRLWQVDFDGEENMLGIRRVHTESVTTMSVFPNPVSATSLNIQGAPEATKMYLISSTGQQWAIIPEHGKIQLPAGLISGLYYLRSSSGNNDHKVPVMIAR